MDKSEILALREREAQRERQALQDRLAMQAMRARLARLERQVFQGQPEQPEQSDRQAPPARWAQPAPQVPLDLSGLAAKQALQDWQAKSVRQVLPARPGAGYQGQRAELERQAQQEILDRLAQAQRARREPLAAQVRREQAAKLHSAPASPMPPSISLGPIRLLTARALSLLSKLSLRSRPPIPD